MSKSNVQQMRAEILKEQAKLVKVENELKKMIEKVNQDLNVLKVEEFQLRSTNAIRDIHMKHSQIDEPTTSTYFSENPVEINGQDMDLDLIIKKFEEEDDSD